MMMTLKILNKFALEVIGFAYKTDNHDILNAIGLTIDDARIVSELTTKESNYIIDKGVNLVNTQVDICALKDSITRCKNQQKHDQFIHDAILLGATRQIMHDYAKISYKQFSQIRCKLDDTNSIERSSRLNDDQIQLLSDVLKNDIRQYQPQKHPVDLAYLVNLSKKTELSIGSIYAHLVAVWSDKYDLR